MPTVLVFGLLAGGIAWYLKAVERVMENHASLSKISDSDLETIIDIHRDCFTETRIKNLSLYFSKYYDVPETVAKEEAKKLAQKDSSKERKFFRTLKNVGLMREKGTIIGMYNCEPEHLVTKGAMMVYNVCLRSDRRGQGLGKQLMHDAIDHCKKPGMKLALTVYQYDKKVINFYKRLEFTQIDDLEDWDNEFDYFNKILMEYQPSAKQ